MPFCYRKYLLLLFFAILTLDLQGQEKRNIFKGDDFSLFVNGEVYTYQLLKKEQTTIIATNGIELRVDNMVITAKKAAWYPHSQDIYIEGDIEVKGESFLFRSQQMTYNLKDHKGIIQKPEAILNAPDKIKRSDDSNFVEIDKGKYLFVSADRVEAVKNTFYFTQVKITSNGYAIPFYHIKASDAKYKSGSSFQSWNNILKIGKVPIFYFPYLAKDLKNNWPWFHLSIDQNSRYGLNATLKMKTTINDNNVMVVAKEMELRGLLGRIEYFKKTTTAEIKIDAESINEKWRGKSKFNLAKFEDGFTNNNNENDIVSTEDRFRLHGVFKQDLMWNFSFDFEADKIDSTSQFIWKSNDEYRINHSGIVSPFDANLGDLKKGAYRRDYNRTSFYEDKTPENIGQLKWIKGPYMARMIYKFNPNDFSYGEERNNNEELEIQPGILFDVHGLEILDATLPLYLDGYARLESLSKKTTHPDNSITDYGSERMALRSTLSTRYSIAQMFNVEVFGGFDEPGYTDVDVTPRFSQGHGLLGDHSINLDFDLDSQTDNNLNRFSAIYGSSVNFEAKNYYSLNSDLFHFQGLIHRIVPRIDFFGSSKPNKAPDDLPQFDVIDSLKKDDYFLLNLKNFFDIKRSKGWVNFVLLDVWAKYNLDRNNEQAWEHITTEVQFRPSEKISLRSNFRFRPGEALTRSISAISIEWSKNSELTVAERWEENFPWQTDLILKFKMGQRYSIETGFTFLTSSPPIGNQNRDKFTEYYFAIQRKYHELVIAVEYRRDRLFGEQSLGLSVKLF